MFNNWNQLEYSKRQMKAKLTTNWFLASRFILQNYKTTKLKLSTSVNIIIIFQGTKNRILKQHLIQGYLVLHDLDKISRIIMWISLFRFAVSVCLFLAFVVSKTNDRVGIRCLPIKSFIYYTSEFRFSNFPSRSFCLATYSIKGCHIERNINGKCCWFSPWWNVHFLSFHRSCKFAPEESIGVGRLSCWSATFPENVSDASLNGGVKCRK